MNNELTVGVAYKKAALDFFKNGQAILEEGSLEGQPFRVKIEKGGIGKYPALVEILYKGKRFQANSLTSCSSLDLSDERDKKVKAAFGAAWTALDAIENPDKPRGLSGKGGGKKGLPPSEREYSFRFKIDYNVVNLDDLQENLQIVFKRFLADCICGHAEEVAAYKAAAARRTYGGIVSSLLKVLDKEAAIVALTATIAQDKEYGKRAAEWATSLVNAAVAERETKEAAQEQASKEAQE